MRVFALSDIHIDFPGNRAWIGSLSEKDYQDDILILAGDVSHSLAHLQWCFETLVRRFHKVAYVPGNHDLWVVREGEKNSLEKFQAVYRLATACGVSVTPTRLGEVSVIPLYGWYDYSFGPPSEEILAIWMDFQACVWPAGMEMWDVATYFLQINEPTLVAFEGTVVTFSHFLPRIDLMPAFVSPAHRILYPVLGTSRLELQVRKIRPSIHVYGHSHVNQRISLDGITYVNNALGYPHEKHRAVKQLMCIHQDV